MRLHFLTMKTKHKISERATIVGPVAMFRLTNASCKYMIRTNMRTADQIISAVGYGDDLRECWLDMFATFNAEHAGTYVVNGRLQGHEIQWHEIIS
jgi:hypothetical protein